MKTLRRDLFVAFFAVTVFLCIIPIFTYVYFAKDLSPKETLLGHNDTGIELLDKEGRPFFTFFEAKPEKEIPLSSIPKLTQQSFIAMEDKTFYKHPGFSIRGILRSLIENIEGKSLSSGGSTITQQLVKNSLLTPKKDIFRKIQEIILAQEIERRYSKDQILEMYLNSVYFGEGAFGIEGAAKIYFGKKAEDLDLSESAILVAILPSPSRMSLFNKNIDEAKFRQRLVLEEMFKEGYINEQEKNQALEEDIKIIAKNTNINAFAPHFALMVRDELVKKYGEEAVVRSGFKVKTTLNLDWQRYAEEVVVKQVEKLKVNRATNGAAVVLDPKTSEIRALVGSKDWYNDNFGKVNIALSDRPPGSAFKPIIYIRALEKNLITPASILHDQPTSFANFDENKFFSSFPSKTAALTVLARDPNAFYKPVNYDSRFRGQVTVRRALANSLNVPSVEVMKKVGVDDAIYSAQRLGLTTLKDSSNYGLSLVLGTAEVKLLEMTNAYAVFANNGYKNNPTSILEIKDKRGDVIYKYEPVPDHVVDGKYTFLISSILSDNKTRAEVFGDALNISRPAAVKTGTTEDYKDAWTIGYTSSLVVGVWIGNNYNEPMDGVAGSLGAAPIWKQLMEKFLAGSPVEEFKPPSGVVQVNGCKLDNKTKIASYSATSDYFVNGTEPANCRSQNSASPSSRLTVPKITNSPTPSPTTGSRQSPTPTSTSTTIPTPTPTPTPSPTPTSTPIPTPSAV